MKEDINDHHYKIITVIEKNPHYTQRKIAKELGYSLGKVNYVIASLVEKGIIKLNRFLKSEDKWEYRYMLTSKGIHAKYHITKEFLARKTREYEDIIKDIEEAKRSLED
jgi:EPS-associated MarR family transcriptional regulator